MIEVKICGVCRPEDARAAAAAGASWIGVILAPGRTRSQTRESAAAILAMVESRRAGVFVDAPAQDVLAAAGELELDAVQLHGDESPESVAAIRDAAVAEVWKAVRVRSVDDVIRAVAAYDGVVDALLLDGWSADAHGGAGAGFDWEQIATVRAIPPSLRLIVAGGLNAQNVTRAIALLRPAIVDVSSGVEEAPGRKSHDRMREFVAAARGVKVGA